MKRLLTIFLLLPVFLHAQVMTIDFSKAVHHAPPGPSITLSSPSLTLAGNVAGTQGTASPDSVIWTNGDGTSVTTSSITGIVQSLDNSTFTTTLTITTTTGAGSKRIYFALGSAATAGVHAGTVTFTYGSHSAALTITGTTASAMNLSVTPTSVTTNGFAGIAGAPQTITATFAGTTITATAPTGTEVSKDGGSTYAGSQTFSTGSPLALKLRTAAADGAESISGHLALTGSGVTEVDVTVTGTVSTAPKDSMRVQMNITVADTVAGWSHVIGDPSDSTITVIGGNNRSITFQTLNPTFYGQLPPSEGATPAGIFPGDGLAHTTTFPYATGVLLEDVFTANVYDTTKHLMQFSGLKPSTSYKIQLGGILQYNQNAIGYYNVAGAAWQTRATTDNNGVSNPNPAQMVWTLNSSSTGVITISYGTQGSGNVAVALGVAIITEQ